MNAATRTSPLPAGEGPSGGEGMQLCMSPIVGRPTSLTLAWLQNRKDG